MAKVVITIEDKVQDGVEGVSWVMEPSFETMMKMNNSGHDLTAAQGYAIAAANHIRAISKDEKAKSLGIVIPKLGRA